MAAEMAKTCTVVDTLICKAKLEADVHDDSGDETTPTTTVSECSEVVGDDDIESVSKDGSQDTLADDAFETDSAEEVEVVVPQLGPGLFPADYADEEEEDVRHERDDDGVADEPALAPINSAPAPPLGTQPPASAACEGSPAADHQAGEAREAAAPEAEPEQKAHFSAQETLFVFDWDDTILPSSWIQRQGLRLDEGSVLNDWQRQRFAEVAEVAAETLRLAKQHGTVVLLTNAERGWIELSCQKFIPTLLPSIENVKIVSARTTYERPGCTSPLDWKVQAFEAEIARACGAETIVDPLRRKNIHSIGDSVHEREALLRATASLPNCRSKSLKFVERPDISQILKQHTLVTSCFDKVVHHDGNLDLCINCS